MKKIFAALAAVLLAALALTGCGASAEDCKGDPGKVTDKESDSYTTGSGKNKVTHWEYELTIQRGDGTTYEKEVSSTAYDWYKRGSKFPSAEHCDADS